MKDVSDVTRREFIRKAAIGGATLLAPGVVLQAGNAIEEAKKPASGTKDPTAIENELLRIELDSDSGDITGLYSKRAGKEYISAKKWARAFRLNVPLPGRVTGYNADYSANSFDSWKQTKCLITKSRDAEDQIVEIQYPSLESEAGKFPIELSYSIRLPDNSDEAILQLKIVNRTSHQIKEVFFPWIAGIGAVEDQQTDAFVAPNTIQSCADLKSYKQEHGNWEEYPYLLDIPNWPHGYSLSMPWMNYGGKKESLYFASLSRTGERHMLMIQDFGDASHSILGFAWAIPAYIAPGRSWQSPEMIVSLHSGDWHIGADKYRTSIRRWYKQPEIPPQFKKAIGSFNSFFTSRNFMQIAELAEDIRKYDLQHLVMWNFGDYYPDVTEPDDLSVDPPRLGQFTPQWGGLSRLKEANKKAQDLGVSTGIIFSQRLWDKDTLTPELHKLAEQWMLRRESGDPVIESWDHQHFGAGQWSHPQQSFGHLDYVMCDAMKGWQDLAIHNILKVVNEAGYSMMFYDQAVETNLCFSQGHHHADVSAPSMSSHGFLKSLKTEMIKNNSGAVLMGEGWEVMSSQVLDAMWVWRLPANPEVFRYTLPWVTAAAALDVDRVQANKFMVLGLHMGIVAKSLENGKKLSDFPEFAEHLTRLVRLRNRTERFWTAGTFQDDIGLETRETFGKIYTTDHEAAIMMANLTDKTANSSFELDAPRYGIASPSYSLTSSDKNSEHLEATQDGASLKGTVSLEPYQVIAIVFRRNGSLAQSYVAG